MNKISQKYAVSFLEEEYSRSIREGIMNNMINCAVKQGPGYVHFGIKIEEGLNKTFSYEVKHIPVKEMLEGPDEVVVDGETFYKLQQYCAARSAELTEHMDRQFLKTMTCTVDNKAEKTVTFDEILEILNQFQGETLDDFMDRHLKMVDDV